jgi:hypothetical protein
MGSEPFPITEVLGKLQVIAKLDFCNRLMG